MSAAERNRRYRDSHKAKCAAYGKAYRQAHKSAPKPQKTTKACTRCLIEKPPDAFYPSQRATGENTARGGLGVESVCKTCRSRRNPILEAKRQQRARENTAGQKTCNVCGRCQQMDAYAKRRASVDGRCDTCRTCAKERNRLWRLANPGAFARWYRDNFAHKSESFAKWRSNNKEHCRDVFRRWARANPGSVNAMRAKRNATKLRATPKWVDFKAIKTIYAQAAKLTSSTGVSHHVDHIVPLQGRLVCGLHVAHNLQVLTGVENIRKKNRFTPLVHTASPLQPSAEQLP